MFLAWLFYTPRNGTLMSDSDVELRRLVNALPQYEEQIRYWESQLDAISNVKTDIFQAQDTINGMVCQKLEFQSYQVRLDSLLIMPPLHLHLWQSLQIWMQERG